MPNVDWNSYQERAAAAEARQSNFENENNIGFFSLKNDKDEAIVRFVYSSPEEFELIAAHTIRDENGRFRTYNCLRNPRDPMDMCPLCEAGEKVGLKFYIKLIHYVPQADGTVVATPKVWERSGAYAQKLAGKMAKYGPLKDCLYTVTRHGAAGSMKTEYDIDIVTPNEPAYNNPYFNTQDGLSAFEGFKALGRMCQDRNYEDLYKIAYGNGASAGAARPVTAKPTTVAETMATPPVSSMGQQTNFATSQQVAQPIDAPAVRTYREPTQQVAPAQGSEAIPAARPKRTYW